MTASSTGSLAILSPYRLSEPAGYFYNPWPPYASNVANTTPLTPSSFVTTPFKKINSLRKHLPLIVEFSYDVGSGPHLAPKTNSA